MSGSLRRRILASCYQFLVPVARFLLRSGISATEFLEVARLAFVHVAVQEFGVRGRETNSSRIAAMTGIQRKEVARLRGISPESFLDPRRTLSPLGQIVQEWATNSLYKDENGATKRLDPAGNDEVFERLVRRFMGDVPLGAVRSELIRLGAVLVDEDGMLRLQRSNMIPDSFDEKLISAIAYSLRGLAETIAYNTHPGRDPATLRIERYIESRPLSEAEVVELRESIRLRLHEVTLELDRMLSDGETPEDQSSRRIGIGVYFTE